MHGIVAAIDVAQMLLRHSNARANRADPVLERGRHRA
jgi:hypothetical protein